MTIDELIKIVVDNGVTVGVLIYFMYNQNKTLTDLKKAIDNLTQAITRHFDKDGDD